MAHLAKDRDTVAKYLERTIYGLLGAAAKLYGGAIVCWDANGYLVRGSDTAGLLVAGRAMKQYDNSSGANGDVAGEVEVGVFEYAASAALAALGQAAVGQAVYIVDDNTVGLASDTTNGIVAGILEEIVGGRYFVHVGTSARVTAGLADLIGGTPTITADAEGTGGANMIQATVQMKDADGNNLAARQVFTAWLSDTAGAAPSGVAPTGAVAVSTGVQVKEVTTKVVHTICTDANGTAVVQITESGAKSYFLNVAIGHKVVSQQLTWTT